MGEPITVYMPVQITNEMIDAGVEALRGYEAGWDSPTAVVESVLRCAFACVPAHHSKEKE